MTSVTSAPRDPRQLLSVTKRGATPSSATSQAADDAIRRLVERRRRRNKYGDDSEPRTTALSGFTTVIGSAVNDSVRRFGLPMWLVRVAVATAVVVFLASAVLLRGWPATRHSVDGTVLFAGRPLANAMLAFHKTTPDTAEPITLNVDAGGGFRTAPDAPLPAGLYAVVVQPASTRTKKSPVIPPNYGDPASTPLRVLVTEDLVGLKLLVRR